MEQETKIIHVHLIFKKIDRYFGSIRAIYTVFSADEIGITEETLMHKKLEKGSPITTQKAIIKRGKLIKSKRK